MDPALHWIVRGGLALLMATAAFHKLSDLGTFIASVRDYRIAPGVLAPFAAGGLVFAEIGIAIGLLLPGLAESAAFACAALLLLYSSAIGVNLARGRRHIDCGCLGPRARQPISGWLLIRNAGLVFACALAALPVSGRALHWVDGVSIAGGLAVACLLYQGVPALANNARRIRSTA